MVLAVGAIAIALVGITVQALSIPTEAPPSEEDQARLAVMEYSTCRGQTLGTLVGRYAKLMGLDETADVRSVRIASDSYRVTFEYRRAATSAGFIYHPSTARVDAENKDAAAILQLMGSACGRRSGT